MSSYADDVSEEFDEFENVCGVHDIPLADYAEWLEEVINIAQSRLAAANEDMGVG